MAHEPIADKSVANELAGNSADHPLAADIDLETQRGQKPEPEQNSSSAQASAPTPDDAGFFSARPTISRQLSAYEAISQAEDEAYSAQYPLSQPTPFDRSTALPDLLSPTAQSTAQSTPKSKGRLQKKLGLLGRSLTPPSATPSPSDSSNNPDNPLNPPADGQYVVNPADGSTLFVPTPVQPVSPRSPLWWEKQPYSAIAYTLATSGILTGAWLFGILVAQILPGSFTQPPLQETLLRKSSRLTSRLWHFPQLLRSPTTEIRVEAIPLPETGPVLAPISLPPIERQPLIDELNSIETEVLTLDRRVQTLEQRLGKPPYQGADVESRVNLLRATIDPIVQSTKPPKAEKYAPTPTNLTDQLLEVAKLKITLPSDALFSPGQSDIKDSALLNQVLDQLVNYPQATVLIRSYSDDQAEANSSRKYTLAQAEAISAYLRAALPNGRYRWVTVGNGQSQPLERNDTDTGRQRNRRIEILVDTRP
ncbi:MAG: OmpA family protein [Phormidesmis sp.]